MTRIGSARPGRRISSAPRSNRAEFHAAGQLGQRVAALDHPHICALYDVGEQDGVHYLVMQHLEGETLAARLERSKALPIQEVLKIATEIADALDKAHRAGITHRDLKPANIMLTKSGAKLLDFGLAKLRGAAAPISLSGMTRLAAASSLSTPALAAAGRRPSIRATWGTIGSIATVHRSCVFD